MTWTTVGNRLVKNDSGALTTSIYDVANQLQTATAAAGVTTYTFDHAGNELLVQAPGSQTTTSTWDNENHNTLVLLPSAVANTFVHNGDGLRFQKQDSLGTTRFVWDDQAYLAETDGNNILQAEYTNEPTEFGSLVSQRRLTSGVWVPSYYQFDGLGAAVQLTNPSGGVIANYLYNAFGEQLIASLEPTINPFRWLGQVGYYFDPNTGQFYVRARIYDPASGRWRSVDPIGFDGGDWNLYRYVLNGPTTYIDPSGLIQGGSPVGGPGVPPSRPPLFGQTGSGVHSRLTTPAPPLGFIDCLTSCYEQYGSPVDLLLGYTVIVFTAIAPRWVIWHD
jgi:RHS repeat-associated protein